MNINITSPIPSSNLVYPKDSSFIGCSICGKKNTIGYWLYSTVFPFTCKGKHFTFSFCIECHNDRIKSVVLTPGSYIVPGLLDTDYTSVRDRRCHGNGIMYKIKLNDGIIIDINNECGFNFYEVKQ